MKDSASPDCGMDDCPAKMVLGLHSLAPVRISLSYSQDPNPFRTPQSTFAQDPYTPAPIRQNSGLVGYVSTVAALMIVVGILDILVTFFAGAYSLLFLFFIPSDPKTPPNAKEMFFYFGIGAAVASVVFLFIAILRIYAAVRIMKYRDRTLGIIALIVGLLPSLTFYCAPFCIGIAIFGLVVLFDPEVARVFASQTATNSTPFKTRQGPFQ